MVPRYLISSRDKSWGVGRKETKEGANLWGCTEAAAALATDAQRNTAHMPRGPVGSRARHKAAGCAPNSLPSPEEGPGATVGKARATAQPPSSQPPGWGTTLSSRAGSLGTCFLQEKRGQVTSPKHTQCNTTNSCCPSAWLCHRRLLILQLLRSPKVAGPHARGG